MSGPARIFATTTSAFKSAGFSSDKNSCRRSATPFCSALLRLARIACGSISIPTALFAPSFNAAMAKIPEPQPKSMTVLSFKSRPSSHSKHSAVVGCVPVPNAKPGSSITLTAFSSGTSRQLGQIHKRLPNCIGWKLSIHSRSQSLSSICSILYAVLLSKCFASFNNRTISAISVSASNNAITSVLPHKRVSPGKGSKIGVS